MKSAVVTFPWAQSRNFAPNFAMEFKNLYQILSTPNFAIPNFAQSNPPPPR